MFLYKAVVKFKHNDGSFTFFSLSHFVLSSTYDRCYNIGRIVTAPVDTLGLMAFETIEQARVMRQGCHDQTAILHVEGIGQLMQPDDVVYADSKGWRGNLDYVLDLFYSGSRDNKEYSKIAIERGHMDEGGFINFNFKAPPDGTVCFNKIRVIGLAEE